MKREYINPEMNYRCFSKTDIIKTSGEVQPAVSAENKVKAALNAKSIAAENTYTFTF